MRPAELRVRVIDAATGLLGAERAVEGLIHSRLEAEPAVRAHWDSMSDEQARIHEGEEHPTEAAHHRASLRYFHAWRVKTLKERLGDRLTTAKVLDVGDVDGLILSALGKPGLGFNLSPAAVERIRANGIEAQLGDGHTMPFGEGEFDVVLCFETLEHVESPVVLLEQLAHVCAQDGRVFVSIPWVSTTFIHPRNPSLPRGHSHVFEFSRDDFVALVSHTPLEIRWDAVCDLLGRPHTPAQAAAVAAGHASHLVGGMFHRFQFFELAHRP